MTDSWSPLLTTPDFSDRYLEGLHQFSAHRWRAAKTCFLAAQRQAQAEDIHCNLYTSYYGLSLVYMNDVSGLNLCRRAAAEELFVAGVFANLAHAEIRLNHRRRAYEAVCRGLRLDPDHVGLRNLRLHMGVRRTPPIAFLSRSHILNRILGKLTYRQGGRRRQPFRAP
ncbi:MAG: hypothetical protein V3S33_03455 [Gammaproteobacteria bacterium]